jgi:hypothetical protein
MVCQPSRQHDSSIRVAFGSQSRALKVELDPYVLPRWIKAPSWRTRERTGPRFPQYRAPQATGPAKCTLKKCPCCWSSRQHDSLTPSRFLAHRVVHHALAGFTEGVAGHGRGLALVPGRSHHTETAEDTVAEAARLVKPDSAALLRMKFMSNMP